MCTAGVDGTEGRHNAGVCLLLRMAKPAYITAIIRREAKSFFQLRKTERLWHIPALAALCTGLPIFIGYFFHRMDFGVLSCIGGLVILYLPTTKLEHRMVTLAMCCFGFVVSFTVGAGFGFNLYVSAAALGIWAFGVNWLVHWFKLPPPGNFFFIFIATLASCMPFDPMVIPTKTGLIAMGTISAFLLALIYSLSTTRRLPEKEQSVRDGKPADNVLGESVIIGVFMTVSLGVGLIFKMEYPYWIPVSCLAIMQGMNVVHVGQRSFHRIAGTVVGMLLAWGLLKMRLDPLEICICVPVLQFVIEMLVVRHYALAVVFITPMTMFLAELGKGIQPDPDQLVVVRLLDIVIGSLLGLLGGILLHNPRLSKAIAAAVSRPERPK
jgi:Fusaric acid resistance protein-like